MKGITAGSGAAVRPAVTRYPYVAPAMRRLGSLSELTRRVGTNVNALRDKPGGGTNKTQ